MFIRLLRFLLVSVVLRRLPWGFFLLWFWRFLVLAGITGFAVRLIKRLLGEDTRHLDSAWAEAGRVPTPSPEAQQRPASAATGPAAQGTVSKPAEVESVDYAFDAFGESVAPAEAAAAPVIEEETIVEDVVIGAPPVPSAAAKLRVEETVVVEEVVEEPPPDIEPDWIRGDGSFDCPDDYPVKAKSTSNIFYVPGSGHYDRTVPDVCFASEDDARASGYRPPKRG